MKELTVGEIASIVNGELIQGNPRQPVKDVSTDTRTIKPGDLFFALAGEKYDGHDFVGQAVDAGAGGLVLAREIPELKNQVPVIIVQDTLKALQLLASYNRRQFDIPVIGITGSNGKTTTKDLVASVLSQKYRVLKTRGNLNNEIGLPLTLLQLDEHHTAAVLEMGMRGLGQIDELCRIAGITAGVITNIGETHLELLGSVENIAQAKGEILKNVPAGGFGLVPADSPHAKVQAQKCKGKVYTFGVNCTADYTACDVELKDKGSRFTAVTPAGKKIVEFPVPGRHNISNAMAALAVGLNLGLTLEDCVEGLEKAEITSMRLQVITAGEVTIINDTYNANPDSTKAALDTLKDLAGGRRQVAVLGSMFELGWREKEGHYETGKAAAKVDLLVAVGELAKNIAQGAVDAGMLPQQVQWFADKQSAAEFLKKAILPRDVVLVKGSRGMRMEELVEVMKQEVKQ
ncbi:MAG: UDP-N-acetylmuramoyl-tripeptide--D-alanyl-D-alanine ligase [Desulfotomaculum sp.]|nr:UDP-N-acetylmuramoyl-tripeptide--D-alanyl-D-alanine ligase [Desulfotomaculum sp.]